MKIVVGIASETKQSMNAAQLSILCFALKDSLEKPVRVMGDEKVNRIIGKSGKG